MKNLDPVYQELAAKVGAAKSEYAPLILAKMATLEQAKIVNAMPAASAEEVAAKLDMDLVWVEKQLQILYQKGLILPRKKGGLRAFYSITELKDTAPAHPKFDDEYGQEFFNLWDDYFNSQELKDWWENLPRDTFPNRTKPTMRIVAKSKAIQGVPGALWFDDIREMLKQHDGNLGLNNCSCRRISRRHAPSDIPDELCLVEGKTAEYCADRGSGKMISLQEAYDFLEQTEKLPMIYITYNEQPMERLICSCGSYCIVFRWSDPGSIDECNPSRFRATVDAAKCVEGCRICIEICAPFFKAPQLGGHSGIEGQRARIDTDKCWGCGNCVVNCPAEAITMECVEAPEYVPEKFVGFF